MTQCSSKSVCRRSATKYFRGRVYCYQHDPRRIETAMLAKKEQAEREREKAHRYRVIQEFCEDVPTDVLEKLGKGWMARMLNPFGREICKKVNQSQN